LRGGVGFENGSGKGKRAVELFQSNPVEAQSINRLKMEPFYPK
jgi:hypothetical protein